MPATFASEDTRKTKLFNAWITHLTQLHTQLANQRVRSFFEGTATVVDLKDKYVTLELEDGRTLTGIEITPDIRAHAALGDAVYAVLGEADGQWHVLDVITIGSLVDGEPGGMHVTVNPLHVEPTAQAVSH